MNVFFMINLLPGTIIFCSPLLLRISDVTYNIFLSCKINKNANYEWIWKICYSLLKQTCNCATDFRHRMSDKK